MMGISNNVIIITYLVERYIQNVRFKCRMILFTQPLRSGRIWHKVNFFKRSLTGLNSEFSFS